ncbi:DUF881 domain-containing protein [Georgenia faecalis]|uniref:DUF881 domain-containing protein n=1 Tax=Georgenia faecalis TaxID=2483799 RepID=UPI0019D11135|nr:DUF881 domain-containing protein [Georgenia faecalis]
MTGGPVEDDEGTRARRPAAGPDHASPADAPVGEAGIPADTPADAPVGEAGIPADTPADASSAGEARTTADTPTGDPEARRPRRAGAIGVGAVAALAGLLFATNASIFSDDDDRHPADLVQLARAETERLEEREAEVGELRAQLQELVAEHPDTDVQGERDEALAQAAGRTPMSGPGVVVALWDAPVPPDYQERGLHPDDLVVHQQDVEAVINALWAGGAEAMMIEDQRIVSTSAVRCIGNVLLLHDRHYSPPYDIAAIGDPDELRAALADSPAVEIYLQYVDAVNLGWSLKTESKIEVPAYEGGLRMDYARAGVPYAVGDAGTDEGSLDGDD